MKNYVPMRYCMDKKIVLHKLEKCLLEVNTFVYLPQDFSEPSVRRGLCHAHVSPKEFLRVTYDGLLGLAWGSLIVTEEKTRKGDVGGRLGRAPSARGGSLSRNLGGVDAMDLDTMGLRNVGCGASQGPSQRHHSVGG